MSIFDFAKLPLLSPATYDLLRFASLVRRKVTRRPHDDDFVFFARYRHVEGAFVDVGANGGQAAVAFSLYNRRAPIVSFEPNPAQEPMLENIGRMLGSRFSYRMVGLGAERGSFPLYIPQVGSLPITTRASLRYEVIEQYIAAQPAPLRARMSVIEVEVQVEPLDEQGLKPAFVKIDVEGMEHTVLQGMRRTLARDRPVVMLEYSTSHEAAIALLTEHGYDVCALTRQLRLVPLDSVDWTPNNLFGMPREQS